MDLNIPKKSKEAVELLGESLDYPAIVVWGWFANNNPLDPNSRIECLPSYFDMNTYQMFEISRLLERCIIPAVEQSIMTPFKDMESIGISSSKFTGVIIVGTSHKCEDSGCLISKFPKFFSSVPEEEILYIIKGIKAVLDCLVFKTDQNGITKVSFGLPQTTRFVPFKLVEFSAQ